MIPKQSYRKSSSYPVNEDSPYFPLSRKPSSIEYKQQPGVIVSVSPQGNSLYAVVRKLLYIHPTDKDVLYFDGGVNSLDLDKLKTRLGPLFGNVGGIPEKDLIMAEVLIITDVDMSDASFDVTKLIGRHVQVELINNIPRKVITAEYKKNSRAIGQEEIWTARNLSPDKSLNSPEAKEYLKNIGYTEKQLNRLLGETFGKVQPEGYELSYGNAASWNKLIAPSLTKNLSEFLEGQDPAILAQDVTSLPDTCMCDYKCPLPNMVFSAK